MAVKTREETTLFDRLGGVSGVRVVVDQFYERILADDNLRGFFAGVNMSHLKLHQLKFLKMAFTEIPEDVNVKNLIIEKHCNLFADHGLNETHFDLVAGHLVASLAHLGVASNLIDEAVGIVAPLRPIFEEVAAKYNANKVVKQQQKPVHPPSSGKPTKERKSRRRFISRLLRSRTTAV